MRQNEIILVSQNKSTLDYIENHLSYSLKKAVCHLSRSRKIHKTDEISEIKKNRNSCQRKRVYHTIISCKSLKP